MIYQEANGTGLMRSLENCSEATTIVFDKTGTLTCASPRICGIETFGGTDADEMLRLAACLEEHYPHSIANAVVREAQEKNLNHEERHSTVEYIVAHGIASSIDKKKVCIGSYHFIFEDEGAVIPEGEQDHFDSLPDEYSHLYLAIEGKLAAVILIEDPLKAEAPAIVRQLHSLGIDRVVMMTGDSNRTACAVAKMVGVDDYYAEVLPEEKAAFIRREHSEGRKVIMVGDGVNDSPALSESDCGIAINSGAAIAREIADITISEDDLYALVILKRLSDSLMERIHGNYRTILSFNSFLMVMGGTGSFPIHDYRAAAQCINPGNQLAQYDKASSGELTTGWTMSPAVFLCFRSCSAPMKYERTSVQRRRYCSRLMYMGTDGRNVSSAMRPGRE